MRIRITSFALAGVCLLPAAALQAQNFQWKGITWTAATGSHAPGPNEWSARNVFVDGKDCLHLKITKDDGVWHCASLNTVTNLGFGTYQWTVASPIDRFDPNVVLGLFQYGGVDNVDEIDIEYTVWQTPGNSNGWFTVYPDRSFATPEEKDFTQGCFRFANGGATTTRYVWNERGVDFTLMSGEQPAGTTANVLGSWSFHPAKNATLVPQNPMGTYMNLWLRYGTAPVNGQGAEVVLKDFSFVPSGPAPLPKTPANLLANADFEKGTAGWLDWAGLSVDTVKPHSGKQCLKIELADGGGAQEFPVGKKGWTSVTLGGWGRASVEGELAAFGVDCLDTKGNKIAQTIVGSVTNTDWTYASAAVSLPSDAVTVRAWVYHNPGPGCAFFDDLELQAAGAAAPKSTAEPRTKP